MYQKKKKTLVQLRVCLLWDSWDDLRHEFSGSLLSSGTSGWFMLEGREWSSESTPRWSWSSLTSVIAAINEVSSATVEVSINWIPNNMKPPLGSCFLSDGCTMLTVSVENDSDWVSGLVGQYTVEQSAASCPMLLLIQIEPTFWGGCKRDEGHGNENDSWPRCNPEKGRVWLASDWDFHGPTWKKNVR